jgi:hypothetical protein
MIEISPKFDGSSTGCAMYYSHKRLGHKNELMAVPEGRTAIL